MKSRLVICFLFLFAFAANAARKPHDARQSVITVMHMPALQAKKSFSGPVKNRPFHHQSETFHRDNCNRTVSQCRTNGNDNIISGHALPLALTGCDRSQHACPVLPCFSGTLSRLLLFPNHYFW